MSKTMSQLSKPSSRNLSTYCERPSRDKLRRRSLINAVGSRVPRIYCPMNLFPNTKLGGTELSGRKCRPRVSHGMLILVPRFGVLDSHDNGREYYLGSRDASKYGTVER